MTLFVPPDDIRTLFSRAMSDMYRREVPQYGALIDLVRDVNEATLAAHPDLKSRLAEMGELDRLDIERHGAIRVGTAAELALMRRMFAVMGMYPVGYYDLSAAGLPVHSTAFRPIDAVALKRNPFRVFTSLLRLELLEDRDLAETARRILEERHIVTKEALELIDLAEQSGGLSPKQAEHFVQESLETFRWHSEATVGRDTYQKLHDAHRLVADVVSFRGPHINHLTPRTLDIDTVQKMMPERGMAAKAIVEGPPGRTADILLRQTSFKALEERIRFCSSAGTKESLGTHAARFGEIEQRGVALTPKGRALYDKILSGTRAAAPVGANGEGAKTYGAELEKRFAAVPDDFDALRQEKLAFFRYRVTGSGDPCAPVDDLIKAGVLRADPQTYEDFLPVSAAGIFQSNLGTDAQSTGTAAAHQQVFEEALGTTVLDEMKLYRSVQEESLKHALQELGKSHVLNP